MTIRKIAKFVLIFVYLALALLITPLSVWLLFSAVTWVGIGLAMSGLIAIVLPVTCFFWYQLPVHYGFWKRVSLVLGLIAPSFGFGNWRAPGSVEAVLAALDDVAAIVEIDQERVYLAGISNGGLGVSQLAEAAPGRFRGLIFISPVMATEIVDSKTFLETWRGRPVLVISGEADRRIPISNVNQRVATLKKGGVAVTDITYSNEDHFLFFSQPGNILADIATWLQVYSFSFHTLPNNWTAFFGSN